MTTDGLADARANAIAAFVQEAAGDFFLPLSVRYAIADALCRPEGLDVLRRELGVELPGVTVHRVSDHLTRHWLDFSPVVPKIIDVVDEYAYRLAAQREGEDDD